MKVLVFDCRKVLEINCRKMYVFTCFLHKFCPCGKVAVDGGHDYLKRCGNLGDWEDLSKVEFVEENDDN